MNIIELWDLYTRDRIKTGETHIRGNKVPKDRYHLVVNIWVKNSEGKYLISQRAANRPVNPLKYECICGSVLKGESSIEGAIRETKEEVGLDLDPSTGKLVFSEACTTAHRENYIVDIWIFNYDGEINLQNATSDEVKCAKWMTIDKIYKLYNTGMMASASTDYFDKIIYAG